MELLYEAARPEPRLRRLLGHISTYENTSRWCQEDKKESVFYISDEKKETEEFRAIGDDRHQNGVSTGKPTQVQRFRISSEFQATSWPQLQPVIMTVIEVIEDNNENEESDGSDESEESEESEADESNSDGSGVGIDDENPVIERAECSVKALSLRDKNYASELWRCRGTKEEHYNDQELWEQQPRVLTDNESKQAFYDLWL